MAVKAMVFIDGSWLYRARAALFGRLGESSFEIDYAKLPRLVCEDVANLLDEDVSLVRTLYFGTIPSPRSGINVGRQQYFYDFLEKTCNYEMTVHEVDVVKGGEDREENVWVKMALGASMLFYAGQCAAYDLAILVSDSPDYAPVLRMVRRFGKRVQAVGIRPTEQTRDAPSIFYRPRTRDFPPAYLDDHAADLRLVRERIRRICQECGREEETTWAGPEFFCSACRGHRHD